MKLRFKRNIRITHYSYEINDCNLTGTNLRMDEFPPLGHIYHLIALDAAREQRLNVK